MQETSKHDLEYASGRRDPRARRKRHRDATSASFAAAVICGLACAVAGGLFLSWGFGLLPKSWTGGAHGGGVNLIAVILLLLGPLVFLVAAPTGTVAGIVFLRKSVLWDERYRSCVKAALAGCAIGWAAIFLLGVVVLSDLTHS